MSTRENRSEPDATRKYNITLKAPPCLCVQKIQYSGGVSRQIQHSASPRALLASQHTPSYCIFRTHMRQCFNSNLQYEDEIYGVSYQESIRVSDFVCNGCVLDCKSLYKQELCFPVLSLVGFEHTTSAEMRNS